MITVDPNKVCYIFDVDGTLTEPRQKMDSDFANEFILWSLTKQCYVATGSDYRKTQEQVPWDVLDCFKNIFCCMGNEVRRTMGQALHKSEFVLPEDLDYDLQQFLKNSKFTLKPETILSLEQE